MNRSIIRLALGSGLALALVFSLFAGSFRAQEAQAFSRTIQPGSDLSIGLGGFGGGAIVFYPEGGPPGLAFTVHNPSRMGVIGVEVKLYNSRGFLLQQQIISLAGGETKTVIFWLSNCNYYTAAVDPDQKLSDPNRRNNNLTVYTC